MTTTSGLAAQTLSRPTLPAASSATSRSDAVTVPRRGMRWRLLALLGSFAVVFAAFLLFVRPWYATWGTRDNDVSRALPGDGIIPNPTGQETRAITINAPIDRVWPWLAQLGQDRGGFYSYDLLENIVGCQMPTEDRLRPDKQSWQLGDKLWMYPKDRAGGIGFATLREYVPGRALAFATHVPGSGPAVEDGSWAYVLEPLGDSATRLLVRGRVVSHGSLIATIFNRVIFEPVHFVMERRTMIGLKQVAEDGDRHRIANHVNVALWAITFGMLVVGIVMVLRRESWMRSLIGVVASAVTFQFLTLAQPPVAVGVVLIAVLGAILWPFSGSGKHGFQRLTKSRLAALVSLTLGPLACVDRAVPTEPTLPSPALAIADAAHGFTPGFYWLPPLGQMPALGGTFDGALAPEVEICELAGAACGRVLATFTMTAGPGPRSETVRLDGAQYYAVNWDTRDFDLTTDGRYRILVRAGLGVLLGYADVTPVRTGSARKNVDASNVVVVVIGRTLPIKFRIETGIVGQVSVTPPEASIEVGTTQQFVATLGDLHGNPATAAVTWASSNEQVATVSSSGVATAVAAGQATITATAGQVTGSATLTVTSRSVSPAVTGGFDQTCALTSTGRAYCWGIGWEGALGTGSLDNQLTPAAVAGGLTFSSLDAGDFFTCGLTTIGQAYCWGAGYSGELGNGSNARQLTPTPVASDLRFASISLGSFHTCAVTPAGVAYCWGSNSIGQLGDGSLTTRSTPAMVSGGLTFAKVSAGHEHTCGITTAGQAYCWGQAESGQLGIGVAGRPGIHVPTAVATSLRFTDIVASGFHTCAITTTGQAYCWGSGVAGRLGTGSTATQLVPAPVLGGLTFAQITSGYLHTCGLTTAGQAYCWGDGRSGQLGTGSTTAQPTPAPVAGGLTFASISAGYIHTCAVIVVTGQPYCWGAGADGQLGIGSTENQLTPVPVGPLP